MEPEVTPRGQNVLKIIILFLFLPYALWAQSEPKEDNGVKLFLACQKSLTKDNILRISGFSSIRIKINSAGKLDSVRISSVYYDSPEVRVKIDSLDYQLVQRIDFSKSSFKDIWVHFEIYSNYIDEGSSVELKRLDNGFAKLVNTLIRNYFMGKDGKVKDYLLTRDGVFLKPIYIETRV